MRVFQNPTQKRQLYQETKWKLRFALAGQGETLEKGRPILVTLNGL